MKALAFLKAEYRLLTFFVIGASIVLAGISFIVPTTHILIVAFIFWSIFLCFGWKYGNENRNKTNVRTTQRFASSLKSFFGGGTVMGLGLQV
jgi:K(+)-stimulated pyrophosphate-energized sodium pump